MNMLKRWVIMVEIKVSGKLNKCAHIWFAKQNTKSKLNCDVYTYYGVENVIEGSITKLQHTLITDLTEPQDEIFQKFAKNTKYEINRSDRDGVQFEVYTPNMLKNNQVLNDFVDCYLQMYKSKNIKCSSPKKMMKEYINADALEITLARYNGKVLVYHTYVRDSENVRLFHSCSDFRNCQDSAEKAIVGRANRFLHWNDMIYYKENGIRMLDWGGIQSYEEPNGIDKFKMDFGGEYKCYYNYSIERSCKAKIFAKLKKLLRH